MKRVVIKIGTNVIAKNNNELDAISMKHIVEQIVELHKKGHEIILVSSGAVGAGRGRVSLKQHTNDVTKRQVLAAVGQIILMGEYNKLFGKHHLTCAQVLATKQDFGSRIHFLNMKNCFEGLLHEKIIPIVNENDVVSVTELMFTDNDELAGLVAGMMGADAVLLLSSVDGVLDKDGKVVQEIKQGDTQWKESVSEQKSLFGRGGMVTKCKMAHKLSSIGIDVYIANGRQGKVLGDIIDGKKVGTHFVAQSQHISSAKKWVAYAEGYEKGVVHLNICAEPALRKGPNSLLPVGITRVEGSFQKGDVIKIKNHEGNDIGFGRAEYGSEIACMYAGKKGKKVLVHYDYLYLV